MQSGARKVKVTISVSSSALRALDQRRGRKLSRSAAIEADIEESNKAARQRALDEEIRAYYSVPPTKEEEESSREMSRRTLQAWDRAFPDDDWGPKRKRK